MNKQETEQYFRDLNDMLRCNGWKHLVSELQATAHQINSVELTKDSDDLFFRKGQLAIIANILNFETQVANAQDEFEASDDETA